jgi:cytochrome c oxidase subunit IV
MKMHWTLIIGVFLIILSSLSSVINFTKIGRYLLWPGIILLIIGTILSGRE